MDTSVLLLQLEALKFRLDLLEKENAVLKERLSKYEPPKTSRNSSVAPSKDEHRPKPNQSLCKSSGKKPGGQLGHKGKTLEMTSTPDHIIELHPSHCYKCGSSLEVIPGKEVSSGQVLDIPPIKAVFIEYRSYSKSCSCGCQNKGAFPEAVTTPVSYGPNIESLVGYFHARQSSLRQNERGF